MSYSRAQLAAVLECIVYRSDTITVREARQIGYVVRELRHVPLDVGAIPADVVQVDPEALGDSGDVGMKRI